eukprot:TRINITY_DN454_c0_g1_i2.p1 TRINITY_DN454_c0_g1~~TRINITY_DN454_c0_g1_i2.p1  ORF type:complete len:174 (+),score=53.17 TRINITY_DN454_c0_g1_i2:1225-1746(+)
MEREREIKRREAGKLAAKTREELAEIKAKQEAEKRRREKAADKAYLQKLKDDMAKEKAMRAKRNKEFEVGAAAAAAAAAPATTTPAPKPVASAATSCLIQVRLTNGSTVRNKFEPTDTVKTLVDWIAANRSDGAGNFVVITAYPRKQLGPADMSTTLADAGLTPRGQVSIQNA